MTSPEPAGPSDRNPWSNSEKILFYGFLMLVVVKATSYWVGAWHFHPDESWATLAMYRGKDMQSFPIMSNLAHSGFGEPSLFESHNQGLLSERYVPWALHAALFRLFGGMGFFVADLILTPLRFALMFLLLRRSGVGRALAIAVSAVLTCSVTGDFGQLTGAVPGIPILFWGLRIPRPYVSELFLLGTLVPALIIGRGIREDARTGVWPWLICGTSAGLLLQSDFYAGTGLGIGLFGILALAAWRVNGERRVRLVRGSVIAAVSCAVILLPMVIQTLHLNPEGPVRLGLFTVPRTHPFFIPDIAGMRRFWHCSARNGGRLDTDRGPSRLRNVLPGGSCYWRSPWARCSPCRSPISFSDRESNSTTTAIRSAASSPWLCWSTSCSSGRPCGTPSSRQTKPGGSAAGDTDHSMWH